MDPRDPTQDAVLGRSLAETAALNAPGHRAGLAAAEAVRRSVRPDRTAAARRFRRALLSLLLVLALAAGLAGLLEAVGL